MTATPTKKINNATYFENLTIYVMYVFNKYIKFYVNHILFTI